MCICVYTYIYIYIYITPLQGLTPNLPTRIIPTKVRRLKTSWKPPTLLLRKACVGQIDR